MLPADAGAAADARERNREFMAKAACALFAAGAVFFASIITVLIQFQ